MIDTYKLERDGFTRESQTFPDKGAWLDARLRDVTSTESSVLFGMNKYMTPYKLWWTKKNGILGNFKQNERMTWGLRLEKAIAEGAGEDHGFKVKPKKEYIRIPELRIASSFDYEIDKEVLDTLLECKNVGADYFQTGWEFTADEALAPPNIEIQCQHELAVSGYEHLYLCVLVGGNKPYLVRRDRNEDVISEIFQRTARFWESVDSGTAPDPNLDLDCKFISELYSRSTEGKTFDAEEDDELKTWAEKYWELGYAGSSIDKERSKIKAKMMLKIGDAADAKGPGFKICASEIKPKEIAAYTRAGYRSFKVLKVKEKKNG